MEKPQPFARLLGWLRGTRAPRRPRPARFVPMVLERLEERCVTAVVSGMAASPLFTEGRALWDSGANEASWADVAQPDVSAPTSYPRVAWTDPGQDVPSTPGGQDTADGPFADANIWSGGPDQHSFSARILAPLGTEADPAPTPGPKSAAAISFEHARERPADVGPPAGSPRSSTPPGSPELAPASNPSVTPGVVSVPGPAANSPVDAFRITRTPVTDTPLEVTYALTAYSRTGAVRHEGVAVLSPGSDHVDVPVEPASTGKADEPEIVTLTLREGDDYRVAQPSATLVLTGDAGSCSEAALLAAYQEGKSAEAFAALVERNRTNVLRTCYRVLGNWHDAEDVSQLVFFTLAQQQLRLQSTLAGWLHTVARNAAIVFLRSRNRRNRHEQQAAKGVEVPSEEAAHDEREELDAALARLPGPLREAVRLRYLEGLSQVEAAGQVGCPRGTLAQRAAYGVARLRSLLNPGRDSGGPLAGIEKV